MDKVEKKFKTYLAMTSGMTIAMIILGIVFIFMPGATLDVIRWLVTACLIAAGLYSLMAFSSFTGVFILILGAIVGLNPDVINVIPVILGAYILLTSFIKFLNLSVLKTTSFVGFVVTAIMSVIGIICGGVMIANPDATNHVAVRIVGIVMLIYGIADFIDVMVLRHQVEAFAKPFRKNNQKKKKGTRIADIQEAKVVKKK